MRVSQLLFFIIPATVSYYVSSSLQYSIYVGIAFLFLKSFCSRSFVVSTMLISLPCTLFSQIAQYILQLKIPFYWLRRILIEQIIKAQKIILADFTKNSTQFSSLQELFRREIDLTKRGLVDIQGVFQHPGPNQMSVYAPADSVLVQFGYLSQEFMKQNPIKGLQFSLEELVGERVNYSATGKYCYTAFQMKQNQYHGFASPFNCVVNKVQAVKGEMKPLHPPFMNHMRGLIAKNSRIVIQGKIQDKYCAVVAVSSLAAGKTQINRIKVEQNIFKKNKQTITEECFVCGENLGILDAGYVIVVFEIAGNTDVQVLKTGVVQLGDEVLKISKL
ncbi:Phosphatidylserine_decarboxylase proenzyme [Hexamita inflata]|uniref:Phosphatidylserine decarboxylase proenzyme n=1 Tax=Hexamita inflata TaxID=28002 RepID=A0AA86QEG9_9EUKA|nr:Phosphatidylserine decarboxylase proenzyme [Hexamita inflata]